MLDLINNSVNDGILHAHVASFKELFDFAQFFHDSVGEYYFRGQSNSEWKLTTTLERFESQLNDFTSGSKEEILKNFKRLIRGKGLLSGMDLSSDDDFWALGQHYGLPTPLLDWSHSFYIALFFAFADKIPDGVDNIAVWAIQKSATEAMNDFNDKAKEVAANDIENILDAKFIEPFSDVNSRLISQSGLLLQKPSKVSVEDIISNFCRGNSHSPVLAKITMPSKERERVLNNLLSMNISWATIYPGVDGAAMHTKMKMELLDLKVRRMGREGAALHAQKKIFGPLSK